MKQILTLFLFLITIVGYSQEKTIPKLVAEAKNAKSSFKSYDLFNKTSSKKVTQYKAVAEDVEVFNFKKDILKQLLVDRPTSLTLKIPYNGKDLELELIQNTKLLTEDFKVTNQDGKILNYSKGLYYQGIIKGQPKSLVAISVFNDDIVGVASSDLVGDVVVGKVKSSNELVSYTSQKMSVENPFNCATGEMQVNDKDFPVFEPKMLADNAMTINCVRIYYEVAYAPYVQNGSSVDATMNWLTGIQNNISTLYTNDNISMALSHVMVWQTQDPYTGDHYDMLDQFLALRQEFEGDLAHLVNYPSTTSVAYLNSLCRSTRYAYSGINMTYNEVPVYSWTILAMSHEMGHALGSPHTHACVWNGNNTAIDSCMTLEGNCSPPGFPAEGGTIMSYCHRQSVGTNFSNGFGPQPGALIRATVNSKDCLSAACDISCEKTVNSIAYVSEVNGQIKLLINDASSDKWQYGVQILGEEELTFQTTNSKEILLDNLEANTYYRIYVSNLCDETPAGYQSLIFVTDGDYCNGELFVDSGGADSDYGNNETIVKTFYPKNPDKKVTITFEQFATEAYYDFLYVYNGDSDQAQVFSGGNSLSGSNIPGPFTATNASGAITVKFVSDPMETDQGWKIKVDCGELSMQDHLSSKIAIYPNPTTDLVNIKSKNSIEFIKVYSLTGELLKTVNYKSTISIKDLPKGVYIISTKSGDKIINQKVTRK